MKAKLLHEAGERAFSIFFDKGDEVIEELMRFAREHDLRAAHFTGLGAFSEATLAFFERERKDYKQIPVNEQVEVMSLIGNIARSEGEPKVHAHVVVGQPDGTARGGHLLRALVWPTLEVRLVESPAELRREMDEEVGLPLINL